jgi:catechol 2,3-dioxygenase-like lactoylglutathione lyase family enzyme
VQWFLSLLIGLIWTFSLQAKVIGVHSYVIPVSNLEKSEQFYRDLFGFEQLSQYELSGEHISKLTGVFPAHAKISRLKLGEQEIELVQYLSPSTGRPVPVPSRSNDLWFEHLAIVVSDMTKAYQKIVAYHAQQVSPAPQTLPKYLKGAAGIQCFYFHDPDGHVLEIIHFPQGTGAPVWQQKTDRLFMGITHSAIGVSNTSKSVKFYRDLIGLQQMEGSINFGPEQERLTGVYGCKIIVTPLGLGEEPHIELLDYRAPSNGLAYPKETYLNDLWAWQIRIEVDNLDELSERLDRAHIPLTSPGPVSFNPNLVGFSKAQIARDPDGHFITFIEH